MQHIVFTVLHGNHAPLSCRNELTSLPDALTKLNNLVKLNASDNKLTKLPSK